MGRIQDKPGVITGDRRPVGHFVGVEHPGIHNVPSECPGHKLLSVLLRNILKSRGSLFGKPGQAVKSMDSDILECSVLPEG